MPGLRTEFASRQKELEQFISFLSELDKQAPLVGSREAKKVTGRLSVLKASTFLMAYNLVEYSVRQSFALLYQKVEEKSATFRTLDEPFRELWLTQQLKDRDVAWLSRLVPQTHKKAIGFVANDTPLLLNPRYLPIEGNLDADEIRILFSKHGLRLTVSKSASGGATLKTVKTKRNALAHGLETFTECGRQFGVSDLEQICSETCLFVSGVVASAERAERSSAGTRKVP
ncbi:MAG: hypothetical protein IPP88_02650 [Betaproteobacteria bacterium]|nr:hypothetical protein [Betaproteobacteria bacterium]